VGTTPEPRKIENIETLLDLTTWMFGEKDLAKLVRLVLAGARRLLVCEASSLFLVDRRSRTMHAYYLNPAGEIDERPLSGKRGIAGYVLRRSKRLNVADTAAESRFSKAVDQPRGVKATCLLAEPLVRNDQECGVIEVINKHGAPAFNQTDEGLLAAFARRVELCLDNVRLLQDQRILLTNVLQMLAEMVDARTGHAREHSSLVARISAEIARTLGLSADKVSLVELAAFVHDVGKLRLPESLLSKKGEYTKQEIQLMRRHPKAAYELLSLICLPDEWSELPDIAYCHHERLDGSGYPLGLVAEEIPLVSKIIGFADAFEAMTAPRTHREALSLADVQEFFATDDGTQYDKEIVTAFFENRLYEKIPPERERILKKGRLGYDVRR